MAFVDELQNDMHATSYLNSTCSNLEHSTNVNVSKHDKYPKSSASDHKLVTVTLTRTKYDAAITREFPDSKSKSNPVQLKTVLSDSAGLYSSFMEYDTDSPSQRTLDGSSTATASCPLEVSLENSQEERKAAGIGELGEINNSDDGHLCMKHHQSMDIWTKTTDQFETPACVKFKTKCIKQDLVGSSLHGVKTLSQAYRDAMTEDSGYGSPSVFSPVVQSSPVKLAAESVSTTRGCIVDQVYSTDRRCIAGREHLDIVSSLKSYEPALMNKILSKFSAKDLVRYTDFCNCLFGLPNEPPRHNMCFWLPAPPSKSLQHKSFDYNNIERNILLGKNV